MPQINPTTGEEKMNRPLICTLFRRSITFQRNASLFWQSGWREWEWVSSATLHKLSGDKEGRRREGCGGVGGGGFPSTSAACAPPPPLHSYFRPLLSFLSSLLSPHLSPILRSSACPCPLGLAACNLRAWAQRPNAKPIMEAGCVLI